MDSPITPTRLTVSAADHPTGHDLLAIDASRPDSTPTGPATTLATGPVNQPRSWRCRACGAERARPDDFETVCPGTRPDRAVTDGGYSVDDPRTREARSTGLTANFLTFGPGYAVETRDGERFIVDVEAETCNCADHRETGAYCAHLRRADLAIRTGELPGPDGRYVR